MTRTTWDEYFMTLATMASTRATCPRRQVGAVVVNQGHRVVATGYNGSRPGDDHCLDVGCDMIDGSCKRTTHAEVNALNSVSCWKRKGCTLYITDFPCIGCVKKIVKSGIVEVVYLRDYRNSDEARAIFVENCISFRKFDE